MTKMELDNYALAMAQKYRLAISLAILKTKPDSLTIDEYIEELKQIINIRTDMTPNDLDVSACSEDFNIDDDDPEIQTNKQCNSQTNDNKMYEEDTGYMSKHSYKQIDDKHFQNNKNSVESEKRKDKFREVIKMLKGVNATPTKDIGEKRVDLGSVKPFNSTDMDLTQCYDDDDIFVSLNIFSNDYCEMIDAQNKMEDIQHENATKISKNVTSNLAKIPQDDNLSERKRKQDTDVDKNKYDGKTKVLIIDSKDIKPYSISTNNNYYKETNNIKICGPETIEEKTNDVHTESGDMDIDVHLVNKIETQNTEQNTWYSESQKDLVIERNLLYCDKNNENANNFSFSRVGLNKDIENRVNIKEMTPNNGNSQKTDHLPNSQQVTEKVLSNPYDLSLTQNFDTFVCYTQKFSNDVTLNTNNIRHMNTTEVNSSPSKDLKATTIPTYQNEGNKYLIEIDKNRTQHKESLITQATESRIENLNTDNQKISFNNKVTNKKIVLSQTDIFSISLNTIENNEVDNEDFNIENENISEDKDGIEAVPFKILEEMIQIKMYLNKKKELKDSGYKSSQSEILIMSSKPSYLRVGESADCIFNYIISCPLIGATQELTEQISEILGQIIDRLYEDEIYPQFLEELLNSIEKLLHLVYDEESYDFDVLQKKDEQIQRIILLNKSSHIIKYTIEKINRILQKTLEGLTDSDYEIQQIKKLENLCYIFHILQIILPKHKKSSNNQLSQDSQNNIKKLDISDIWRKKWFIQENETKHFESDEKCVLEECSDLLNKIVVSCMDGYSLISFLALKCFNLLQ